MLSDTFSNADYDCRLVRQEVVSSPSEVVESIFDTDKKINKKIREIPFNILSKANLWNQRPQQLVDISNGVADF